MMPMQTGCIIVSMIPEGRIFLKKGKIMLDKLGLLMYYMRVGRS